MFEWNFNCEAMLLSILAVAAIAIIAFVYKNGKSFRQRIFASSYAKFATQYNLDLDATKTELFSELKDIESLDASLRSKGQIRILEVGVGPGSNFKFYPKNARLIAVDPNPHFRQYLEENSSKFPHINLEQVVLGAGEDLAAVKDGSVDVVITTIVLCSVKDVEKVLKEIKRVLAPGGKYFFMEHVLGPEGTKYRTWQTFLSPIWPVLHDNCHLTRDIAKMIDKGGFSETNIKSFIAPLTVLKNIIGPHIFGSVRKPLESFE